MSGGRLRVQTASRLRPLQGYAVLCHNLPRGGFDHEDRVRIHRLPDQRYR